MNIIITVQHGGNVHFFKNVIRELEESDHGVHVFGREQEVVGDLLEAYGIDHELLCDEPKGWLGLGLTQLQYEAKLLKHAYAIRPDHIISSHGIAASHVAAIVGAESHIYIDTETAVSDGNRLTTPFADNIYTPTSFREDYGENHRTYAGYHELGYLRPNRFEPDPSVLRRNGVDPGERYAVLRLGSFSTNHDIGKEGISVDGRRRIVDELASDGRVFVSDEGARALPADAEPIPVPPAAFHHLLAFADLVVGDVATTTLESAILGTPTVRISPFAGADDMGKFRDLEAHGLARSFPTSREDEGIAAIRRLHRDPTAVARWESRRKAFLEKTIDVVDYVLERVLDDREPTGAPPESERRADERPAAAESTADEPAARRDADAPVPSR